MSAAMLKQFLEEAKEYIKQEKYQEALDASRRVTSFDPNNFQALICAGKANFHLQQWEDCEEAYERASELMKDSPFPWKGLYDLYEERKNTKKKLLVLEKLVPILKKNKKVKACQKMVVELAQVATEVQETQKALDAWLLLVGASNEGSEAEEFSLLTTPNGDLPCPLSVWFSIIQLTDTKWTLFFQYTSTLDWKQETQEETVEKMANAINVYVKNQYQTLIKANEKQKLKKELDAWCLKSLQWFHPLPKLPAEWLLLRSEDDDTPIPQENAIEITQQVQNHHPKSGFGLMSPLSLDNETHTQLKALLSGEERDETSLALLQLCVGLQMTFAKSFLDTKNKEAKQPYRTIETLEDANKTAMSKAKTIGATVASHIFSMEKSKLLEAKAYESLGKEGQAIKCYEEIQQQSSSCEDGLVGLVELLLRQGLVDKAKNLMNENKVPSEKTVELQATFGWLKYQESKYEDAKNLLETVVKGFQDTSKDFQALVLKRLGMIYWSLDGEWKNNKKLCLQSFLQAAKLQPTDAQVFHWIGKWYLQVANDVVRGEKCLLKALSLDIANGEAGQTLSELYEAQGKPELSVKIWEEAVASASINNTWALWRLAQHLLATSAGKEEEVISYLHIILRRESSNPKAWAALGHVYRTSNKQMAAQKSYMKALELGLEPTEWSVRCELAKIHASLVRFEEAQDLVRSLLSLEDQKTQVLVSILYAEFAFGQTKVLTGDGLYGQAAVKLKEAVETLERLNGLDSPSAHGEAQVVWKLLGDLHCFGFFLSPEDFNEQGWIEFLSHGTKAYEKALASSVLGSSETDQQHLLYDIALSCWYQAQAARTLGSPVDLVTALLNKAKKALIECLKQNPVHSAAWNGLGLILSALCTLSDSSSNEYAVLLEQFCLVRAVQSDKRNDAAWSNLAQLYLSHPPTSQTGTSAITSKKIKNPLAQHALLQLQSVNGSNVGMWVGYGRLLLSQHQLLGGNDQDLLDQAKEAFACALDTCYDLDALCGFGKCILAMDFDQANPQYSEALFTLTKCIERDPIHSVLNATIGQLQLRNGLYEKAGDSFSKTLKQVDKEEKLKAFVSRGLAMATMLAHSVKDIQQLQGNTDPFVQANAFLCKKQYKEALATVKKQQGNSNLSGWWKLLEGVLLIQLSQASQALSLFEEVLGTSTGPKHQVFAAVFMLAIVSTQQDLSDKSSSVREKAMKLLKEFNLTHELPNETTTVANSVGPKLNALVEKIVHVSERHQDDPAHDQLVLDSLAERLTEKQVSRDHALDLGLNILDNVDHTQGEWTAAVSKCDQLARVAFWSGLKNRNLLRLTHDDNKRKLSEFSGMLGLLMMSSPQPSKGDQPEHQEAQEEEEETYEVDEEGQERVMRKHRHPIADEASRIVHSTNCDPQRFLREQPTSAFAHAVAAGSLIKRSVFSSGNDDKLLQTACRMLQNGLKLLEVGSTDTSSKWLLHYLKSHCLLLLGNDTIEAQKHTTLALEALGKLKSSTSDSFWLLRLELLEARVHSSSNPQQSISLYKKLLKKSKTLPGFQETVLKELGALYEATGASQTAFFLWKELDKSSKTNSNRLWANIRLALLSQDKKRTSYLEKTKSLLLSTEQVNTLESLLLS